MLDDPRLQAQQDEEEERRQQIRRLMAQGYDDDAIVRIVGDGRRRVGAGTLAVQGATFGFGDELEAGLGAGIDAIRGRGSFGDRYGARVGEIREGIADYRAEHPGRAMAAEAAGALGTTALTLGAGSLLGAAARVGVPGAAAAARAAAPVAARTVLGKTMAGAAQSVPMRIVRAVGAGAAQGAAAGTGAAEGGLDARLAGLRRGAMLGGMAGGALGATTTLAAPIARAATGGTLQGVNRAADRIVARAMSRDGVTPSMLRARLASGAVQADDMLLDQGGRYGTNLLGVAQAVRNTPGKGRTRVIEALQGRAERAPSVIGAELERATGARPQNVYELAEEITARQKAAADPLYKAARAHPPLEHPEINAIISASPALRKAYAKARALAGEEGVDFPPLVSRQVLPDGSEALVMNPIPVQALDYMKRGADAVIRAGMKKGNLDARAASVIRKKVQRILEIADDEIVDDQGQHVYQMARRAFGGEAQNAKALELGVKAMKEDPRLSTRLLREMSDSEREHFKLGLVDGLRRRIAQVGDGTLATETGGADVTRKIMASPEWRAKVRLAFDSDDEFNTFLGEMQRRSLHARNKNYVLAGSKTSRAQNEEEAFAGEAAQSLLDAGRQLASGNLLGLASQGLAALQRRSQGMNSTVGRAVANRLTAEGPHQIERVLAGIQAANQRRALAEASERYAARLMGRVAGSAGP